MSSPLATLLGPTLRSATGSVKTTEALSGKTVGVYFSASWCPPCRGFTPKLAQIYVSLKAAGKDVEIIFVSSDKSEAAFEEYYKSMPWLALPFSDRATKDKLSRLYSVSGIPKLVLLDPLGEVKTTEGRQKVLSDPDGQSWCSAAEPKPSAPAAAEPGLEALLGSAPLLGADGKTEIDLAALGGGTLVALYFSAHWCGPCRGFTPKLVAFINALKEEEGVDLPVIFGSSDKDAASFASYHATMPWFAFPHGDARVDALKKRFQVSGIPWLVIVDAQGRLVMNEADVDVPLGPQGAYQKWLKMASPAA